MKFKEGDTHTFKVVKLVDLPDEGTYYVLRHNSGRRLLLPQNTYKNYSIEVGKTIECRVDRVNCTGNVFLEPKHPIYIEGNSYLFQITNNNKMINKELKIVDCFNNQITLEMFINETELHITNNTIELKVVRIKKGKPIVSFGQDYYRRFVPLIGHKFEFNIESVSKNNYDDEVYLLRSGSLPRAELKTHHYNHFGFSIGSSIIATILSINDDGTLKVEPDNPFYKIGQSYEFSIETYEKSESDQKPLLIVYDNLHKNIGIPLDYKQFNIIKEKTRVLCRVIGFRKGKPKLEIIGF